MNPSSSWWNPARHADRRPVLLVRNQIQRAIRGWLAGDGFTEVDPAALAISPGNEAHLHGFATEAVGTDGLPRPLYLHTSPEFAMKKLLAAGETRIHAFAHVWRNRERGPLHSPEFTMLEWYRVGEGYETLMTDVLAFLRLAAREAGAPLLRFRDRTCDPFAEPERLSVAEAFALHAGVDLMASIRADGTTDADRLGAELDRIGLRRVAERFEVYACGVELANGFGELTDAGEQRRRFEAEMAEKARVYGESYPLDEDFLTALERMPAAAGIAMGFDRVVMLATGAPRIEDVMWTPVP